VGIGRMYNLVMENSSHRRVLWTWCSVVCTGDKFYFCVKVVEGRMNFAASYCQEKKTLGMKL